MKSIKEDLEEDNLNERSVSKYADSGDLYPRILRQLVEVLWTIN